MAESFVARFFTLEASSPGFDIGVEFFPSPGTADLAEAGTPAGHVPCPVRKVEPAGAFFPHQLARSAYLAKNIVG
jgi:hypothetical protein